jgi:hypothetical protein
MTVESVCQGYVVPWPPHKCSRYTKTKWRTNRNIQVVDRVFDEVVTQIHDDMKVKLEAVIAAVFKSECEPTARPRYAKKPVDQWKSQSVGKATSESDIRRRPRTQSSRAV